MTTDSSGNNHGDDGRFKSRQGKEATNLSLPDEKSTWPQGEALINSLIDNGDLQCVDADQDGAELILGHAENHLDSASKVIDSDPRGSIALSYDAARKSMVAILTTQGLRASGKDTHRITAEAIEAQLGSIAYVVRPFHRLRTERREAEYYNKMIEYSSKDAQEVLKDAQSIVASMTAFLPQVRNRPFDPQ